MSHASLPNSPRAWRRSAFACGLVLLVLAGCDTTEEPIDLFTDEDDLNSLKIEDDARDGHGLRFEFQSEDVQTGVPVRLRTASRLDVADFLHDNGFTKGEVLAAYVESVRLVVLAPFEVSADFLDKAAVRLEAEGLPGVEVASQGDFPNARTPVALDVVAGEAITEYIVAPSFEVVLQVTPETLMPNNDYELGVVITFRIEVEGI